MNEKTLKRVTDMIQGEVGFFNGWSVPREAERKACEDAAKQVIHYLTKRCAKATGAVAKDLDL